MATGTRSADCTATARLLAALMTLRIVADVHEVRDDDSSDRPHAGGTRRARACGDCRESCSSGAWIWTKLTLADVDAVRFLVTAERQGIVLHHCAPFIREWMSREAEPMTDRE